MSIIDTDNIAGASLDDLLSIDVDGLDQSGVRAAITAVARWSGRLSSLESRLRDRQCRIVESIPARPVPGQPTPPPAPTGTGQLDGVLNISAAEGRRRDARSEVLRRIPILRELLEDGRVSVEHLDQIANCARNISSDLRETFWGRGDEIAAMSSHSAPGAFRRRLDAIVTRIAAEAGIERDALRRSRTRLGHRLDPVTGMGRIWAELDPDLYERFSATLERAVRSRPDVEAPNPDWLRAQVLVELLTAGAASGPGAAAPAPSVSVLIDHQTLLDGLHSASVCEYSDGTSLSVPTARQLACTAEILPVVLGGNGVPLDVGRSRRLATSAQRSALAALHATCAIDRCDVPFDRCEIHHVTPWEHGGQTDLSVLIPLCSHDHHEIHRRESVLTIGSDRVLKVTEADGTVTVHRPDRRPLPASGDDDDGASAK
ncbi:MAG: DUF222 domain-containing protein [Actinomycetota bacterium]|nr:DUF222 domain-containing protein [Actinomycetota bacterium]